MAAGLMPSVEQSRRAVFNVGSALFFRQEFFQENHD
jgi:hypothetical protein